MTNTRRGKWMPGALSAPPAETEPYRAGGVELIEQARLNGVKRHTVGLASLIAWCDVDAAAPRRGKVISGGRSVTIMPVPRKNGRAIDPDAAAALLGFACAFFESGGAT